MAGALALLCMMAVPVKAEDKTMTRDDLILVPEPTLSQYLFGGYELDSAATEAHYNALFAGKSAADIVAFLESDGFNVLFYDDSDRIGIIVRRLVNFFYYTAKLDFFFEEGQFVEAKVGATGVK